MATLTVDCDAGEKIQQKIALAKPGDTVLVSGTCRENLAISSEVVRITLDGQGKAVIQAPGTTADAIFIRGKDITVKGVHAHWRAGRHSSVRCRRGCFGYH